MLAKKLKPFSDGKFLKKCMDILVENIYPDKSSQSSEPHRQFSVFSLALDESTDANDTVQLAVFIRGIDSEFTITEELLSFVPVKGTTTKKDLFDVVLIAMVDFNLEYKMQKGITTDVAASIIGKICGLAVRLENMLLALFIIKTSLHYPPTEFVYQRREIS